MVRFFIFLLLAGVCFAQYQLWAGRASWQRLDELAAALSEQRAVNDALKRSNEALQAEYASLVSNQDAIEERARRELNMIRPDEVLFRIETEEEAACKTGAVDAMPNVDAPEIRSGARQTFTPKKSDLYHAPKGLWAPKARDRRN